jgi:hypothetical protein
VMLPVKVFMSLEVYRHTFLKTKTKNETSED